LGFAKPSDHADRLHRGEAAHQADHRAEDADFGAVVTVVSIMGVTNEAAVAGLIGFPPTKRAGLAVKLADSRRNERHPRRDTQIIDDQPRRKIIASIDHDINAVEQCKRGFAGHPLTQRLHPDIRIKQAHHPFDHIDLSRANISLGIQYLALEIGAADDIIINHTQAADASSGEILDRRAANPASTNDQDMRVQQADLPCPANLLQDDMAGIAIKLFIAKFS
jgi:hypothetical protein